MNNNDKPNTENTSQPEKTLQPEKVPQPQTQLEESPLIRGMDAANATAANVLFTRGN